MVRRGDGGLRDGVRESGNRSQTLNIVTEVTKTPEPYTWLGVMVGVIKRSNVRRITTSRGGGIKIVKGIIQGRSER